jgi:thiol:disulfide interchange protein DsbD
MFMGLTFTLTSFTCTFAIAGGLLASAAQGQFYWPIVGMLAFGTAFAAPFFVLALVPGLLSKLPKSGGWMNTVKVVMGMLELGAAVKFFSIADPRQVFFDHVVVMLLWLVLALVTGLYLLGLFRLSHDTAAGSISVFRALLAMAFLGVAGLLTIGVAMPNAGGGMLLNQILAFAPPRFEAGEGRFGPMIEHHGVEFGLDVDRAIPVAEKDRQPLLLDFTGVNCANCRYMERLMAQPAWKQRIERFAPVQLYVDVPAIPGIADEAYAQDLWKRNNSWFGELFPKQGMPSYAIMTPDGRQTLAIYEGAERADRSGSFTQFLDDGWKAWEQVKPAWKPQTAEGGLLGSVR